MLLLSISDLMLMPSSAESFGLAALEAITVKALGLWKGEAKRMAFARACVEQARQYDITGLVERYEAFYLGLLERGARTEAGVFCQNGR